MVSPDVGHLSVAAAATRFRYLFNEPPIKAMLQEDIVLWRDMCRLLGEVDDGPDALGRLCAVNELASLILPNRVPHMDHTDGHSGSAADSDVVAALTELEADLTRTLRDLLADFTADPLHPKVANSFTGYVAQLLRRSPHDLLGRVAIPRALSALSAVRAGAIARGMDGLADDVDACVYILSRIAEEPRGAVSRDTELLAYYVLPGLMETVVAMCREIDETCDPKNPRWSAYPGC